MEKRKIEEWIRYLRLKHKEQNCLMMKRVLSKQIKVYGIFLRRLPYERYTKREISLIGDEL